MDSQENTENRGAPTKYREDYPKKAYKLALLGATDKQIADFFDVVEATIYNWKREFPEFLEAIKRGGAEADTKMAESLYHRGRGFTKKEVKIFQYEGQPVIVPFKTYYPPDTAAAIFWLKNRQPQLWRDRQQLDLASAQPFTLNVQPTEIGPEAPLATLPLPNLNGNGHK